ncbi:MAG TPA: Lpp/OprI family alanine-zipper lipoprotein [Woeseiaceae bacterium]|nr:Lpp/OprI family alanine-zipper lipoprotein [Woeseiaceae bacterium]
MPPTGEKHMKRIATKIGAVAATMLLVTGCANQTALDEVQATAERAAADAAAAKSAADAARSAADRASQMASSAQSTASQALSAAQGAENCCDANRERLERMFQKSMSK